MEELNSGFSERKFLVEYMLVEKIKNSWIFLCCWLSELIDSRGWHVNGCMDAWMHGWTDGRMDGWTDGRMDGWTDGRMDGRTDERRDGRMDRRTDGWIVDGWMNGWMDEWMYGRMYLLMREKRMVHGCIFIIFILLV